MGWKRTREPLLSVCWPPANPGAGQTHPQAPDQGQVRVSEAWGRAWPPGPGPLQPPRGVSCPLEVAGVRRRLVKTTAWLQNADSQLRSGGVLRPSLALPFYNPRDPVGNAHLLALCRGGAVS